MITEGWVKKGFCTFLSYSLGITSENVREIKKVNMSGPCMCALGNNVPHDIVMLFMRQMFNINGIQRVKSNTQQYIQYIQPWLPLLLIVNSELSWPTDIVSVFLTLCFLYMPLRVFALLLFITF